jgi:hypothetical protein
MKRFLIIVEGEADKKFLIKDANRNYENIQHWNLDAEYLKPLKEFLENKISD